MAKQHFYSRVPARVSLYRKTDGFDTFAHSEGLSQEFVEKELSVIYRNEPPKSDADRIRKGLMPPVYCQIMAKSGEMLQSCISYQPLDYTGERSGFLVHTLILDETEKTKLLSDEGGTLLNRNLFVTDLSSFDLTAPDARPNRQYPEKPYELLMRDSDRIDKYDGDMVRKMIYAMLNIACGKSSKGLYFSLPGKISEMSDKALGFLASLIRVFPYHLRGAFSFVTYTGDFSKFQNFKIKCIPEDSPDVPVSKGISLRFGLNVAVGVSDSELAAWKPLVDFFVSLLNNDVYRRRFLSFCAHVVSSMPEVQTTSLKLLNDLVFIFEACSGLADKKVILPDDESVIDLTSAYEKYRGALPDDYRVEVASVLERYPKKYQAIPKALFNKWSKLYPDEPRMVKDTVIAIVLELIHTDIMRDKLFAFLRQNYDGEPNINREIICDSLCRVYYGGFLQLPILEFFDNYFDNEPESVKDMIVEKMILTIRTVAVTEKILQMFGDHYSHLTEKEKNDFYGMCFEMLPQGDSPAAKIVRVMDSVLPGETDEQKRWVADRLHEALLTDVADEDPFSFVRMVISTDGFCASTVVSDIFRGNAGDPAFGELLLCLENAGLCEGIARCASWLGHNECPADKKEPLKCALCCQGGTLKTASLRALMDADIALEGKVSDATRRFLDDAVILPAEKRALAEFFDTPRAEDLLPRVVAYAAERKAFASLPEYRPVACFDQLLLVIRRGDEAETFARLSALSDYGVGQSAGKCLNEILTLHMADDEKIDMSVALASLFIGRWEGTGCNCCDTYDIMLKRLSARVPASSESKKKNDAEAQALTSEFSAMCLMMDAVGFCFGVPAFPGDERDRLLQVGSSLDAALNGFVQKRGFRGKRQLTAFLHDQQYDSKLASFMHDRIDEAKSADGGLFGRLFGKK